MAIHEFCRVEIFHIGKQGNKSVYLLAKHALGTFDYFTRVSKQKCSCRFLVLIMFFVFPLKKKKNQDINKFSF